MALPVLFPLCSLGSQAFSACTDVFSQLISAWMNIRHAQGGSLSHIEIILAKLKNKNSSIHLCFHMCTEHPPMSLMSWLRIQRHGAKPHSRFSTLSSMMSELKLA